ncbi:hypothetical protein AM500_19215 [Bacillus sp. FJAT-18017]|uniref:hypothetical protein n=1 Tax=Bacillus sp. FJAT-18017 TaxID=1705566 RepID=UPI0006AE6321|nr:hypothetical protein [Bacillus sp. FJAT-18017]ALC91675.1 hypothetical protein AM500_19215 [Bacillus sp. FJAT-18017]
MKKFYLFLLILSFSIITIACSGKTQSDIEAEKEGILSRDEAEVMIWDTLSKEEKEKYTVDYEKESGTKYYLRIYGVDGEIKVRSRYTIDFNTKEINKLSTN